MTELINRRWLLRRRPRGLPDASCLEFVREPVAPIEPGQFLVKVSHLSFDPAQVSWMMYDSYLPKTPLGEPVRASAVGEVITSRNDAFPAGVVVQGPFGWQDYCVTDGGGVWPTTQVQHGSPTQALSIFGQTGYTAYFGLTEIGRPVAGETVLVSAAAGATGSLAGQVAKALGCRVIGIAGGPAKCNWVVETAGFDACIDYRAEAVGARLSELAPGGINVFFDNVGGEILDSALLHLARHARVVVCGSVSTYLGGGGAGAPSGLRNHIQLALTRSRMEGFIILDYAPRYGEAEKALSEWLKEGRLTAAEDVQVGLENAPATLARVYEGKNLGKQLLAL